MKTVEIYTKLNCPYCVKAKMLLDRKNVKYIEIRADLDPSCIEEMIEKSQGRKTFPQIFINDVPIGGCDDLYALEQQGQLDKLLTNA